MVHKKAISLGSHNLFFIYSNYMPIKCEKCSSRRLLAKRPCRTLKRWIKIISKKDTREKNGREFIKMWRSSLKIDLKASRKNIKKNFLNRVKFYWSGRHIREDIKVGIKSAHHCHHHQIISHLHSTSINSFEHFFYFSLKEIKLNFSWTSNFNQKSAWINTFLTF